jgi:hypothetical protein
MGWLGQEKPRCQEDEKEDENDGGAGTTNQLLWLGAKFASWLRLVSRLW